MSQLCARVAERHLRPCFRSASSLVDRGEGVRYSRHVVDRRRIHVVGGAGGNGSVAYTKHIKHNMLGPGWPCGGAGGRGGSVIVQALASHQSLAPLTGYTVADHGHRGKKKGINGQSGSDAIIRVPRGVVVRELVQEVVDGEVQWRGGRLLGDLNTFDDSVLVATGGQGGRGNNMQRPHVATPGQPGEERHIELELKTIADIGLVGMPNAGKSTLLGAVSRATPKIAPYPFTTVAPYVGTVEFADGTDLTIADVPGLVEDAHMGAGLGHEFLRHLERTKILVYIVDAARSEHAYSDLVLLRREVAAFSQEMAAKPCGVVANKCDVSPVETLRRVDALWREVQRGEPLNTPLFVRAASARFGVGVSGLLQELRKLLRDQ